LLAADAYVCGANIGAPDSNIILIIRKYKTILRKYFAKSIFKIVFYFVFSKYFLQIYYILLNLINHRGSRPITAHRDVNFGKFRCIQWLTKGGERKGSKQASMLRKNEMN
jgi:hypothetical protein